MDDDTRKRLEGHAARGEKHAAESRDGRGFPEMARHAADVRAVLAEVDRLRAERDAAVTRVDEIILAALSGDHSDYRFMHEDGNSYVRWARVQRDIHAAIRGDHGTAPGEAGIVR